MRDDTDFRAGVCGNPRENTGENTGENSGDDTGDGLRSGFLIGVISDTHGLLRPEVTEYLKGCDVILHGGDISGPEILDALSGTAPVYAVRGNNDKDWAEHIPCTLQTELFGLRIFMVHKKKEIPADLSGTDLVIYGHSHKYEEDCRGGVYYLNPGSCGPRRFTQPITMALVHVAAGGRAGGQAPLFFVEKIEIPHKPSGRREASENMDGQEKVLSYAGSPEKERQEKAQLEKDLQILAADARSLIEKVTADINRGRSTAAIAKKYGISMELTETISRMYLTHPGITADGIMSKMGL